MSNTIRELQSILQIQGQGSIRAFTPAQLGMADIDFEDTGNTDSVIVDLTNIRGIYIHIQTTLAGAPITQGAWTLSALILNDVGAILQDIPLALSGTLTATESDSIILVRGLAPIGVSLSPFPASSVLFTVPRFRLRLRVTVESDAPEGATINPRMFLVK